MTIRPFSLGLFTTIGGAILALILYLILSAGITENPNPAPPAKTQSESAPMANVQPVPSELQLSMFITSDLHINSGLPSHSDHLKAALEDIESFGNKVQALVMTGDVTDAGTNEDYKELRKILSAYTLPPIYANMGNHDYYGVWIDNNGQWNQAGFPNGKSDEMSRKAFTSFFNIEKPYHDVWINGYHIILLSQETYVQENEDVGEGAWYSEEQMAWFREKISENADGKPTFVMIHQEMPPAGRDGGNHTLIKANPFREIVKAQPNVFVFSGHTHQDFTGLTEHYVKNEPFHWFKNSSVGRVLDHRYQHVRPDSSQGLFVEVYNDKVVLRGREFSNKTWIKEADWTVPLQ